MKGISKIVLMFLVPIVFVLTFSSIQIASATEPEYPREIPIGEMINYYGELIVQSDDGLIFSSAETPLKVWFPSDSDLAGYSNLTVEVTIENTNNSYAVSLMGNGLVNRYYEGEFSFALNVNELFGFYNIREDSPQLNLYYSDTYTDCNRTYPITDITELKEIYENTENMTSDDMFYKIADKCFVGYKPLTEEKLVEIRTSLGRSNAQPQAMNRRPSCEPCPRWLPNCIPVCPPYIPIDNPDLDPAISACGTITSSGNYWLDQDLTSSTSCIDIQVGNVNLDLNGFTITGTDTSSASYYGVKMNGNDNVYNGTIDGFGRSVWPMNSGNKIYNNSIINFGLQGIGGASVTHILVDNNTIISSGTSVVGVVFWFVASNTNTVSNNFINITASVASGLCLYDSAGVALCATNGSSTIEKNIIYTYSNATCLSDSGYAGSVTDYYYDNVCHSDEKYIGESTIRMSTTTNMYFENITFFNNFDTTESFINVIDPFTLSYSSGPPLGNRLLFRNLFIEIDNTIAFIDGTAFPEFDPLNTVIQFNQLNMIDPIPYYDTADTLQTPPLANICNDPPCTSYDFSGGNLSVSVSGWSNYAPQENTTCIELIGGTWNINCSCNITMEGNYDAGDSGVSILGPGTFTFNSYNISNVANKLIQGDSSTDRCLVYCDKGGCFKQ